jgi:spermidine synthase
MGWWLLSMAAWQLTRGSVYSEIGALTAIFMAGLAAGAFWATRSPNPHRRLPIILIAAAALSAVFAAGLPIRFPLLVLPSALGAGGLLTGASFPAMVELSGGTLRRGAGAIFAIDEIGAATAAVAIGLITLPVLGLATTATILAAFQLAAIPAVIKTLRRP